MAAAVTNLKPLLAVCDERRVFIITPCLRYANAAGCLSVGHCTHRQFPEFDYKLLADLGRLHNFFTQRLSSHTNGTVVPAGDLIAGKRNAKNADIISTYSSWGAVHGTGTSYTRMALFLIDNLFRASFREPSAPPKVNPGNRPRSESASSSGSSSSHSTRQDPTRNPGFPRYRGDKREERPGCDRRERGFSRGGFRGGNRGGLRRGSDGPRGRGYSNYY